MRAAPLAARTRAVAAAVFAAAVAAATPAAQEPSLWLHVRVEADGGETGGLDLPVGTVSALLGMTPDATIEDGQLQVDDEYRAALNVLRLAWEQLRAAGDGEPIAFRREDALVRAARVGSRVELFVEDGGRTAEGDLPAAVVDALLSGDGQALNIDAALEALSARPGESIRVTEPDRRIRIWVDAAAEPPR